jgi:hypothetical protein
MRSLIDTAALVWRISICVAAGRCFREAERGGVAGQECRRSVPADFCSVTAAGCVSRAGSGKTAAHRL